jgi:stage III sporulation protein AE
MTAFIPVMAAILAASSRSITAAGASSVMLFACSMLSNVAAFFLAPCMSGYLAISICAGVSENNGLLKFSNAFKKTVMWAFSLAVTIFLGILSIKGGIDAVKDTLSVKTLRYVLGSTVPIAGTVLSESVSNVLYSLTLLKKSAGMYAVVAITLMALPVLIEILCFRLSIFAINSISELFECSIFSKSVEIFDNMLSLLTGLLLLVFALFVISLGIVVSI